MRAESVEDMSRTVARIAGEQIKANPYTQEMVFGLSVSSIQFAYDDISNLTSYLQGICSVLGYYEIIQGDEQLKRISLENRE